MDDREMRPHPMQSGDTIPAHKVADLRPLPIREGHEGECLLVTDGGTFWAEVKADGSYTLGERLS